MDRRELADKLPIKKIDRVIARAKERGVIKGRTTDFSSVADEIIAYEWDRYNELLSKGMRPDGSFEHANKGIVRTDEQKQKYSESAKGNKNACGKHEISDEQRKKWSEIRKGKKPWNYNPYIHDVCNYSNYSIQTVRKYGWTTLDNCKQKTFGMSIGEDEMYRYVLSLCDDAVQNTRKIIPPKELDIYVPSKKVAIEYNGLYWHSELQKDKYYHRDKMIACRDKGTRLVQIYEDEWNNKKEICKSIISSALGTFRERIYARDCEVREVGKTDAKAFFDANHIKGDGSMNYAIGLYHNDELVMCASFRPDFASKVKSVELSRLSSKLYTQVIGGFSKLLKHCPYDEVVSFVDLRLYDGKGYYGSGWTLSKTTEPGYYYTDLESRFGRLSFTKEKCLSKWHDCDSAKSERQLCYEHGLYRIYDCGNSKMTFTKSRQG